MKYIKWFRDLGKKDVALAGGKGANLGEMTRAGFPVPGGFCVTAPAYFKFLEHHHLTEKIRQLLQNLDLEDSVALQQVSRQIRELMESVKIPPLIEEEIKEAYRQLGEGKRIPVAVRSSATAEDLPEASFAGQQQTFLNIRGTRDLLRAVRQCWSSLFTARAIYYREQQKFDHFQAAVAVPVQKMVQSEVSGVTFSIDPISNNPNLITIEAVFGLGEGIVSGQITPDHYEVEKKTLRILKKKIVRQQTMISREGEVPVSPAWQEKQKLPDELIMRVAELARALEKHYQFPQDIEWAVEEGQVYLVQTRPITTLDLTQVYPQEKVEQFAPPEEENEFELLLQGLGASPGLASGAVKIINEVKDIGRVKEGDILVTRMTSPDWVPAMKKTAAIITDEGGMTCHAAIVSRELGIPCVVGTEVGTQTFKPGEIVTVDGKTGKIYAGNIVAQLKQQQESVSPRTTTTGSSATETKTATKIYVNLGEPDRAEEIAARNVDGVGLLRAEFMIAEIGQHPRYLIQQKKEEVFIDQLYQGLMTFARAFHPRPVIYRSTDFKTNEYRHLKGGEKFEPQEANPMLGMRGALRYLQQPEVFELELKAIKRTRHYYKNLWLMIPFVRTVEELIAIKKILSNFGLHRSPTFKLFIMVEVPSTVILIDQFIGVGIDGVSIGSNDLTQLILGADRDNPQLSHTFNELNPAVLWALEHTVTKCREHGILCSICGQAPSLYPELAAKLVEWGISSLSVNPDVIEKTRQIVAAAEELMVEKKLNQQLLSRAK